MHTDPDQAVQQAPILGTAGAGPGRDSSFWHQLSLTTTLLTALVAGFLTLDFLVLAVVLPLTELASGQLNSDILLILAGGLPSGLFVGQLLTLAALTALGDGNHAIRYAMSSIFVLLGSVVLGLIFGWLDDADYGYGELAAGALALLMCFCILQFPFWLLRVGRGWHWGAVPAVNTVPRYGIAHVFGWSALLALPLILYRVMANDEDTPSLLNLVTCLGLTAAFGASMLSVAGRCRLTMATFVLIPIAGVTAAVLFMLIGRGADGELAAVLVVAFIAAGLLLIAMVRLLAGFQLRLTTRQRLSSERQAIRNGAD